MITLEFGFSVFNTKSKNQNYFFEGLRPYIWCLQEGFTVIITYLQMSLIISSYFFHNLPETHLIKINK